MDGWIESIDQAINHDQHHTIAILFGLHLPRRVEGDQYHVQHSTPIAIFSFEPGKRGIVVSAPIIHPQDRRQLEAMVTALQGTEAPTCHIRVDDLNQSTLSVKPNILDRDTSLEVFGRFYRIAWTFSSVQTLP